MNTWFRVAALCLFPGLPALYGCAVGIVSGSTSQSATLASGTQMHPPAPLRRGPPLAAAADARLHAAIDAVIVGNGPGSWVWNPAWDEYVLSLRNQSGQALTITSVVVYDALGIRVQPADEFNKLVAGTRDAEQRYRNPERYGSAVPEGGWRFGQAIEVAAGGTSVAGGAGLIGAFGAAAAPLAAPMIFAGGLTIVGSSIDDKLRESRVNREIKRRQSVLPMTATAGDLHLTLFFPVTPLPRSVEIGYTNAGGDHRLDIDTTTGMADAHLEPAPRVVHREDPYFPESLREHKGYVKANLTVGADGLVTGVQVVESVPEGVFDFIAERAWYHWRFNWGRPGRTTQQVIHFNAATMH